MSRTAMSETLSSGIGTENACNCSRTDRMDEGRLLLAIDGGQTATKALVARLDGTVLGAGLGGPSDHFHIEGGVERNRIAIHGAINSALASANGMADRVAAIALGLTGAPAGGKQTPVVHDIVGEILTCAQITV